jgi:LysR family transcriptional regulator, low CO2-responsive transcriptional regulator
LNKEAPLSSRNLTLLQFRTLEAIAGAGSLVAAAAELHMTPAALTARLKGLESAVGMTLFDRTSMGLRLNSAGEVAREHTAGIERAVHEFVEAMNAVRTGQGGRLSVGVVSTAKYFAPKLIAAFVDRHPKLELRFLIGNRDETAASLKSRDVEIALAGRPPADLPVAKAPIGPHPYVMIAPPGHRLAGAGRVERADLAGEAFLFREAGSGTRSLFDYFIGDTEIRRVQFGMELGSNETIKQAVMAGLGIALISAHTIAAEIADGRLVALDVEGLPIVRQWYVLHRTDRPLSPPGRAFRDFAQSHGGQFLPAAPPLAAR